MDRTEAIRWVLTVAAGLRLSQAKTLGDLVVSTLWVGRVTLAAIGQRLSGSSFAKHRIKRVWRFTSNERVVPSDVMQGVIGRLMRRRWNSSKPLLVALDWTDIRGFCTLMAAAVIKGRAIPLVWASYPKWKLAKSQNNLEEGMLVLLRAMIPQHIPVILLADRGFGRTEFARACQKQGFHYVIRVRPEVWVRCPAYQGSLQDYPVRKGMRRMLRDVAFRKEKPVSQHVIIRWKPGLPKRRDEPWFLMTDLDQSPVALSDLYGRRMTIEELFRDSKNRRNGFALRNTQITQASRLDRLILIVALAYILLVGLGLYVRQHHPPGFWCSSNNPRQCSAFTIGRKILDRVAISIEVIQRQLVASLLEASPNWG